MTLSNSLPCFAAKDALWLLGPTVILAGIASITVIIGISTCYLSIMYKRYSHIPSPTRSRYESLIPVITLVAI